MKKNLLFLLALLGELYAIALQIRHYTVHLFYILLHDLKYEFSQKEVSLVGLYRTQSAELDETPETKTMSLSIYSLNRNDNDRIRNISMDIILAPALMEKKYISGNSKFEALLGSDINIPALLKEALSLGASRYTSDSYDFIEGINSKKTKYNKN